MSLLDKALDPNAWRRVATRNVERVRNEIGYRKFERHLSELGPVADLDGTRTVVADGMWLNPNHFFRLRLFISALARRENIALLAVLRSPAHVRERRAMELIGFREFVYIEADDEYCTEDFLATADALLSGLSCHEDFFALELPDNLPAYTYYDTVLKLAADPRPPLDHPQWRWSLAELLRNAAIYEREFSHRDIAHVALSHPWKSEWACLVWKALQRNAPAYHVTGYCEAIRIRRFNAVADYATPVEHLPHDRFETLTPDVQDRIVAFGERALDKRSDGQGSDINANLAYKPTRRIEDRHAARRAFCGETERPLAVVFAHVWHDFPHTFAMRNFTDFRDWMEATVARIRDVRDVVWLLKPHPTEAWYNKFRLSELDLDLPGHVRLLPLATDTKTVLNAADAVVTVHGTVGIEAAAMGKTVLLADRSYFSDWGFAHLAADREDYLAQLGGIARLARPDQAAQRRAAACLALAIAELPDTVGAIPISCDSRGSRLFAEICSHLEDRAGMAAEVERICGFLDQSEIDSFETWSVVNAARRGTLL